MRNPLQKLVVTIAGDFGKERSRKQLKQWIEINGGKNAAELGPEVTHLVCSEAEYKDDSDIVRLAKGTNIHIVSYDWLEDSIMKKRTLAPGKYLWKNITVKQEKEKTKRARQEKVKLTKDAHRFINGCKEAKHDIFSGESDAATKSSNRCLLDSFMTTTAKKMAEAKAAKRAATAKARKNAKAQATTTKAQPTASKVTKPSVPRKNAASTTKAKGRTKAAAAAAAAATTSHDAGDESVNVDTAKTAPSGKVKTTSTSTTSTAASRTRRRRRKHPSGPDVPAQTIEPPTVDTSKIIRAPTDAQIQSALLEKANAAWSFIDNHHIYRDPATGLDLNIVLIRIDPRLNNGGERIVLRLYESNCEPRTYAAFSRHSTLKVHTDTQLAAVGTMFEEAFEGFRNAFEDLTFIKWAQRERARATVGGGLVAAAAAAAAGDNTGSGRGEQQRFMRSDGTEVYEVPFSYIKQQPMI